MLFEFIIVFCAGMVIGWNVVEQPAWVKDLWDKYVNKKQ
jgi:hypothetical protein